MQRDLSMSLVSSIDTGSLLIFEMNSLCLTFRSIIYCTLCVNLPYVDSRASQYIGRISERKIGLIEYVFRHETR